MVPALQQVTARDGGLKNIRGQPTFIFQKKNLHFLYNIRTTYIGGHINSCSQAIAS
jgi:hypothetical protein